VREAIETGGNADGLVSASEIAQIAHVQPSAVSNWRKRFPDFPAPAGTAPSGGDLFLRGDVERWLREHDRLPKSGRREATQQLWAVADRLRGKALAGDVTGAVAAGAVLLHLAYERNQAPPVDLQAPKDVTKWTRVFTSVLTVERPELGALFEPLAMLDPESLRLLLDSLAAFAGPEELSAAVDYVLERGTRYGEFRTPTPIAGLLTELAAPAGSVFDPAVGSGEFLIQAATAASSSLALFGQEVNESTWRIALARLILRNIEGTVALGDSLVEDRYPELRADVVMCEPPAGVRTARLTDAGADPRWELLGTVHAPPVRASDFIWLSHVIHHLAPNGRGYVLLPTGSLLRSGNDARFRSELLRRGTVEAIVALPSGSLAATAVAPALWIVRPPTRTPEPVLLIDTTDATRVTRDLRSRLSHTLGLWRARPDEFRPAAGFATTVSVLELLGGDAPLVPGRWLREPDFVDANAIVAAVEAKRRELETARAQVWPEPPRFALTPTEPTSRLRVRDLIELRAATLLRPARIKKDQYTDDGLPVWLPGDIREPWRRDEPPSFVDPALVDSRSITEPGDIVFTTIGGIRTRVDDEGGHVLGTSLQALRLNVEMFDPHAVAALLTSEPNRRLLTGTTIPRVDVLELEIPRLPLAATKRVAELLRALEHEVEITNAVAERAEALRKAVIEALATGAAMVDGEIELDEEESRGSD
jgi:hypothetical protein